MKIAHLADLHADDKFMGELVKCGDFALGKIQEEKPDLIVIAGDVFHDRGIKLDSPACKYVFNLVYHMSEVAPVAIVAGTRSHEGLASENLIFASSFEHNVYVSSMPEQLVLMGGEIKSIDSLEGYAPDAIISMVPEFTKQYLQGTDQEMADAIKPLFYGFAAGAAELSCSHILVGHFTVSGATLSNHQQMVGKSIEIGRDDINQAKADVVCLGHIHKSQRIDPNIFYSGSLFRVDSGETEDKGFYIHHLERQELDLIPEYSHSEFITTPAKKIMKVSQDYISGNTELPPAREIQGADVRLEIKLYQDEADKLDKGQIEQAIMNNGALSAIVKIIRVPRETVRSENLMKLTSLRDKIQEMGRLKDEVVSESILDKADKLETMLPDEVLAEVSGL